MYVYISIHLLVYNYIFIYLYIYISVYIYLFIHLNIHVYVYVYVYIEVNFVSLMILMVYIRRAFGGQDRTACRDPLWMVLRLKGRSFNLLGRPLPPRNLAPRTARSPLGNPLALHGSFLDGFSVPKFRIDFSIDF